MRSSRSKRAERAGPPVPPNRAAALTATPFAHRGLHGGDRIENSRAAFAAAIARGHGIELDVQVSRDGAAFVFHDDVLDRLAEGAGRLDCFTSVKLRETRLKGSDETVPCLTEILQLIAGRVPVLIEIKSRKRGAAKSCRAVRRALEGYGGIVGVMSFNPEVGRWFALYAPRTLRGLVVTEGGKNRLRGWAERRWAKWRSRADFLAYDVRDLPSRFAARHRAQGLPVLTWTVRSDADRARAAAFADQIIYEDQ